MLKDGTSPTRIEGIGIVETLRLLVMGLGFDETVLVGIVCVVKLGNIDAVLATIRGGCAGE